MHSNRLWLNCAQEKNGKNKKKRAEFKNKIKGEEEEDKFDWSRKKRLVSRQVMSILFPILRAFCI